MAAQPYWEPVPGRLHQRDDAASVLLAHLDHRVSSGSRLSMMSSPSRNRERLVADVLGRAQTAWPSPFGSPWRT